MPAIEKTKSGVKAVAKAVLGKPTTEPKVTAIVTALELEANGTHKVTAKLKDGSLMSSSMSSVGATNLTIGDEVEVRKVGTATTLLNPKAPVPTGRNSPVGYKLPQVRF